MILEIILMADIGWFIGITIILVTLVFAFDVIFNFLTKIHDRSHQKKINKVKELRERQQKETSSNLWH